MPFIYIRRAAVVAALTVIATAGCTIKNTEPPPLTGPSGLALSLQVTATPDSISQDGGSQSSVRVLAIGPNGQPLSGVPLRLDMIVGNTPQDFGTLSARTLVTNSSGVATAVFTAPPSPVNGVFGTCSGLPGNCVTIVATPTSTDFASSNPEQVQIRLVPTGVILPPAGAPTALFSMSPTAAAEDVPLNFDASASTPGAGATSLTYAWTFGDGTTGTGKVVTHTYGSDGSYIVVLTVTNDRGLTASHQETVVVAKAPVLDSPKPDFTISPTDPVVFDNVIFDASKSTTAAGTSVSRIDWNFGDSTAIVTCPSDPACSGTRIVSHQYTSAGKFTVTMVLTDTAGHSAPKDFPLTVNAGNPTAVLNLFKNGGNRITADGSQSTGRSTLTYRFIWGDNTPDTIGASSSVSHDYGGGAGPNPHTVTLIVTDSQGRTGSAKSDITTP